MYFFFYKQKTAYEMRISDWIQTCALPIYSSSKVDAGGADAYFDNAANNGEQIPGCHRSESAAVHLGGAVSSLNLACSGARTSTHEIGRASCRERVCQYA